MILSLQLHAEFSEKENKLLSILKADTRMQERCLYIWDGFGRCIYIKKRYICTSERWFLLFIGGVVSRA